MSGLVDRDPEFALEGTRKEWKWEVDMLEGDIMQLEVQVAALRAQTCELRAGPDDK